MPDATADGSDVVTELIIDPTAARFAEQWVGYAREAQTFMVMNVGESVAPDLRAELTGEGAADYVIEANECRTLEPSASCALTVAFAPRAGGTRTATLEVRSGTGVARAELSGIGMDPNDYNRVFVSSESLSMLLGSPEAYDAE
ncbi:MAG: choice-of-anchor D domain-containing protein, partial [Myxococcota bacterium]